MPNYELIVTVQDAIHAGIRLGIGQNRTLEIWRSLGGEIRDVAFAALWREETERFDEWARQQRQRRFDGT